MKKSFLICLSILCVWPASFSHAEYVAVSQAPLSIVHQDSVFRIKKDGRVNAEIEESLRVNNDEGRTEGATKRLMYLRKNTKVRVAWAKTVFKNREYPVTPGEILDRAAGDPKDGISDVREKVIPFNNIFVGSEIQYKYTMTEKKSFLKGVFGMAFTYGLEIPEMNEVNKIISEVPLYFKVHDPKKYLEITSTQEKGHYILTIILKKMVFHMPGKEEILPVIDPDTIPTVTVSINKNWQEVNSMFASGFEKVLSQPLPKEYLEIFKKAEKEKNQLDRINVVTSELAQQMTYAGDWKRAQDMFFPKDLKKISNLKTGDCKDFATATAAILRKMGMTADVALVQRMLPTEPGYILARQGFPEEEPIVNLHMWNHAIVKVTLADQKEVWIDPTNPVSNAGYVKSDINQSPALVLNPKSQHLETVHALLSDSPLVVHRKIKIRGDETAELTASVDANGIAQASLLEVAWQKGSDALQKIYESLLGFGEKSLTEDLQMPKDKSRISKATTVKMSAVIPSPIKEVHEDANGKKTSKLVFQMGLPTQLKIYTMVDAKRTSNFAIGDEGQSITENEILGYHVKDFGQADCLMLSPWLDMERSTENTPEGMVVRYSYHQKRSMMTKTDLKSRDFSLFKSDLSHCIDTQAFEVEPVSVPAKPETDLAKAYDLVEKRSDADLREARRVLLKELAKNPKNAKAHAALARVLISLGYLSGNDHGSGYMAAAEQEADLALQSDANAVEAHLAKARVLVYENNLDKAKTELVQAYHIDNKNRDFFSLASLVSEKENKFDLAERYLQAAIPLAQDKDQKVSLYNRLGIIKENSKDYNGAVQYFKKGLEINPKDSWLLGNCMNVYMDQKKWDDAIEIGKKSLEISEYGVYRGTLAHAYSSKGIEILNSGNLKPEQELEAEKLFQSALKLQADQADGIRGLGVLYYRMGSRQKDRIMLTQAKQYLERSFAKNPLNLNTVSTLIEVRKALGLPANLRLPASNIK